MSNLQIVLSVVGLAALALIVAWNVWTVRRSSSKKSSSTAPTAWSEALRNEPGLDSSSSEQATVAPTAAAPPPATMQLDARIDSIAEVEVPRKVSGEAALGALGAGQQVGKKPFAMEGMHAETRQWEALRPGQFYTAFQAGVQLYNGSGALTEAEFVEFTAKVREFSDAIHAFSWKQADMHEELARARELGEWVQGHHFSITMVLKPRQAPWSADYVRRKAEGRGFVLAEAPGCMALPLPPPFSEAPGLPPLLSLEGEAKKEGGGWDDNAVLARCQLVLMVPRLPPELQPVARLRQMAAELCADLDAHLCEQGEQLLEEEDLETLERQVQSLYRRLQEKGLPAGTAQIQRLFD